MVQEDLMFQTVNVGGDSAISRVTVTGRNVSDIIVTARIMASPPQSITLPDRPVYQYIEVNLSRCGVISDVRVEFALPLSIADHAASPDAVGLCTLGNNSWICLPATMAGDKNGKTYYSANSPVFTFLAITVRSNSDITTGERFSPGEDPKKTNTDSDTASHIISGIAGSSRECSTTYPYTRHDGLFPHRRNDRDRNVCFPDKIRADPLQEPEEWITAHISWLKNKG